MTDEITLDAPETRIERFLAAAAGVDGITLDEPETRIERYLYKIAQGSGGVPPVEDADKGKYLHANESTGDLEWATAGGSGDGRFVVTFSYDAGTETWSADKTRAECVAAWNAGKMLYAKTNDGDRDIYFPLTSYSEDYIQFAIVDAESLSVVGGYAFDGDNVTAYGNT